MFAGVDAKLDKKAYEDFRDTFLTPHGRRTFAWLLWMCHYFNPEVSSEGATALRNLATRLIGIMAADQAVGPMYVTDAILTAITNVPLPKIEEPKTRFSTVKRLLHEIENSASKDRLDLPS